jgi:hypothetical protein
LIATVITPVKPTILDRAFAQDNLSRAFAEDNLGRTFAEHNLGRVVL